VKRRGGRRSKQLLDYFTPLNDEISPMCHLIALSGAHNFVDVSRIRVKEEKGYWRESTTSHCAENVLWTSRMTDCGMSE